MTKLLRPRLLGLFTLFLFAIQTNYAQQEVIHCWDFNSPTGVTGNQYPSPVNLANRTIGGGIITHGFASATTQSFGGSTENSCSGSSAGQAFVVRGGATLANNGRNLDLNFSTEDYENLVLSFWTRRTSTGFTNNQVRYSIDNGLTFTDLPGGNYFPVDNTIGVVQSFTVPAFLLDLNDQPNLIIRIVFNGATAASGNNRIDNLKLEGTPINSNDEDSVVIIPDTQVPSKTVTALDFANQAESIFSFDIQDLGTSDALPTNVTRMQFLEGPNNTVNWSTAINSLVLRNELGNEITGNFSVSGGEIIFEPDTPLSIADGTSENYIIEAILNSTGIIDRSVIQLSISEVDADFDADVLGSQFTNIFPAEVLGNEITIDVVATDIAFLQQPSDVGILASMQPDVEVEFVDVNGNRDLDITDAVEISSSGDLVDDPVSANAIDGVASFSNLVHSTTDTDLVLTATTLDPFSATSDFFDVIANDETSEVATPTTQIGNSTIIAANSTVTPTPAFNFDISDLGSGDGLPTEVNQMRFVGGTNNTTDWSTTFSQVIINGASGEIDGTYAVTENEIIFTPDVPVTITDGLSENFSLEIVLNTNGIIDQSVIQFQVEGENSGFGAEPTGSAFNTVFTGGAVSGNDITIEVIASEIAFVQQPTDVEVNAFINPAVQIAYVDENGNIDTSITTDISLASSDANLVDPITPVPAVNGVATFPNIGYTAEATGVILTAETTEPTINPSTLDSNPFDVGTPVIAIQDFDGTQPEWLYDTSVPTFDNGWGNGFFGVINSDDASPLASGSFVNNIFGENDLNENNGNGTTDFASLDFVTVDISGYTDVNFSFDWEVFGYNVSNDRIEYEVFFDGVSQGRNTLFEGGTTEDASGTFSLSIPDTVSEVSFSYFIQNDGLTGYSGLDNVKLTGNSNARDTDIIAPIAGQIPAGTLIADVNDEIAEAVEVFSFEVVDSGNFDDLSTNITRLRFVPGALNTANWEDVIQGISISDGTTTLDQGDQTVTITTDEIIVDITADPDSMFIVGDNTSKAYTLSLFLNPSDIIDQEVIQLAIAEGNENQLASSDGSIFSSDITTFEGNEFLIDVVGNGLEFIVQPTTTVLGENMTPAVRVANTDTNGNLDLDSVGVEVVIESTGSLDGEPITQIITTPEGYANFNTLQHSALGFDLTLSANALGFTGIISDEFDITFESNLLISEVVATFSGSNSNNNTKFVELFNMSVETLDFTNKSYYLHNATSGNSILLSGSIPPKSYYIISFADASTFSGIYNGVTPDLQASTVVTSDGTDSYFLSIQNTRTSLVDVHGVPEESGPGFRQTWDYSFARFYRNIPTVRNSNPVYDESGEWIKEESITIANPTPGVGDNDFIYSNDTDEWAGVGIGESPEGSSAGLNDDKSIFVENGTVTLAEDNLISDVVVRAGATLILNKAITLNGDFANFGKVIFRSTEKETAALGPFDSTNRSLVGTNFEIERFIPANNRAFRYLSSSVITTSSINDNWQEGVNNTGTVDADPNNNINLNPGFGTHITGSTTGANGFDATLTGNPSMFDWNTASQQWNSITNTDTRTFAAGSAFSILIRGDRSTNLNSNSAVGPSTTLRTTGRLVVGSRGVGDVASSVGGFSLIGNPYQAKVDMQDLLGSGNSSGVSSQFVYIYDPTLGSVGGYATVDLNNGTTTPPASGANQFLDPNQAFFVETTGSSQAVVFREPYKTTDVLNNTTFSIPEDLTDLKINLFAENIDKPIDGLRVKFRVDGNNAKDTLDATKVWNYEEAFAIDRNPNYMSIENRAMPTAQDSVQLYFGNSTRSAYRLEIEPENFKGAKVYLQDRYLETITEIPSDSSISVPFELDNSIPASKATDRFVIKFEEVSLSDDDFELTSSLVVYPNPVRGERFSISHQQAFSGSEVDLKLFDLQGRLVMDQKIDNAHTVEVNVGSNLSSGVYILRLSDGNVSQSLKLIVE